MKEQVAVWRNKNISLLLGGQFISSVGDWFYQVALSIAIYDYSGGKGFYVGLLWILRFLPGLLFGPISGRVADRLGYRRTMVYADLGRLVIVGILAIVLHRNTWVALYPLAFANSVLGGLFRPASVGFIPSLAASEEQQMTANASLMQTEAFAGIIGSALGGIMAGAGQITLALALDTLTFAASAGTLMLIRTHVSEVEEESSNGEHDDDQEISDSFFAGVKSLAQRPVVLFVASVMLLPELASGAGIVWIVPYGEQVLHLGEAGVGYLYAMITIGGLLGGFIASLMGGNLPLDRLLAIGVAVGGIALAVFGVAQFAVLALICAVIIGLAETVEFAAFETLIQQAVPKRAIGQAMGTMDSLFMSMMLIGTACSGLLASAIGVRASMVGLGGLVVIVVSLAWINLQVRTAGQPSGQLLAKIPALAAASPDVREWAVRRMMREKVPSGATIIRQGDEGDRFYAVAKGRVQVQIATDRDTITRELSPGDFFGEIALLQNVPRTATVVALDQVTLWTMSRADFLELQNRASEFKETLWETATARLQESTDIKLALSARP